MARLKAGTAQIVITPPVGVDLCGFAGRPGPSEGVHDDLYAKALYLASDEGEIVMVTADLIGLSAQDVAAVRDIVHREAGLPPDAVMVSCSHTHSGPATRCIKYLGDWDQAYLDVLVRKIASVAVMAARRAQPAVVGWHREPACIHVNRRQRTKAGVRIGVKEGGVTLPWVDVLAVEQVGGRPLACWFTHAAHAVTLRADNLLISADWPGYAQRALEGACPGATALFAQGCCGNLNSHPQGSFEIAERQGWVVAGAALKGAALAEKTGDAAIGYASGVVRLPLQDPPPLEEAEAILQDVLAQREAQQATAPYQMRKTLDGYVEWARQLVELARRGEKLSIDFEIQALRIGDGLVVGLPGEVFAEYALAIANFYDGPTAVVAYTNGNFGYVPTRAAFEEGGYEVQTAVRFYLPLMLAPQCEELILEAAKQLVGGLAI